MCQLTAHFRLHCIRQAQQLGLEVIEGEGFVVYITGIRKRIARIKQCNAQRTGYGKNACQTNSA